MGVQTRRSGTGPKAVGMGLSSSPIANLRAKTRHQDLLQAKLLQARDAYQPQYHPTPVGPGWVCSLKSKCCQPKFSFWVSPNTFCGVSHTTKPGLEELLKASKKQFVMPIAKGDHEPCPCPLLGHHPGPCPRSQTNARCRYDLEPCRVWVRVAILPRPMGADESQRHWTRQNNYLARLR